MSDCATREMRFETRTALTLEAAFDGRRISSDRDIQESVYGALFRELSEALMH